MNKEKKLIELSEKYFNEFNDWNLNGLRELFDINIELIDWVSYWKGVEDVLSANDDLFKLKPSISVIEIKCVENRTYNKILINVGSDIIKVMDIIDWTEDLKIKKVEAYKG